MKRFRTERMDACTSTGLSRVDLNWRGDTKEDSNCLVFTGEEIEQRAAQKDVKANLFD